MWWGGASENPTKAFGSEETVRQLISPLDNFYSATGLLESNAHDGGSAGDARHRPISEVVISAKSESIRVIVCNTAILSSIEERPGSLLVPYWQLPSAKSSDVSTIVVFHHPYPWLNPDNRRAFQGKVEGIADLVLTGHEHDVTWRAQSTGAGAQNTYFEGGVFQDRSDSQKSVFNALVLDTEQKLFKFAEFVWDGKRYALGQQSLKGDDGQGLRWEPFLGNRLRRENQYVHKPQFAKSLIDLGVHITHPDRETVTLDDVFVYPDLALQPFPPQPTQTIIPGNKVVQTMLNTGRVVISGSGWSGKTALARKLTLDLLDAGKIPILLLGDAAGLPSDERLQGYLERAFTEQYASPSVEDFRQQPRSARAVIIDDFHRVQFTGKRRVSFLQHVIDFADTVILLFLDVLADFIELVTPTALTDEGRKRFSQYRILPLGHVGREHLMAKWIALEDVTRPGNINRIQRISQWSSTLNTFIGRNYLPAYPIYILSVLQTIDAGNSVDTSAGTHGYFYELIISLTLSKNRSKSDYDIVKAFLAYLAFYYTSRRRLTITEAELRTVHKAYSESMIVNLPFDRTFELLLKQEVLTKHNDQVGFCYGYYLYYFTALYLRDNLHMPDIQAIVCDMADNMNVELNANVMLFLCHLSKSPIIIECLLKAAASSFAEYADATLAEDVAFVAKDVDASLTWELVEQEDIQEERESRLATLDEAGNRVQNYGLEESVIEPPPVSVLADLELALTKLQVIGQVLKNHPGSMPGPDKSELAAAAMHLGFRIAAAVLDLVRQNEQLLLVMIARTLMADHPSLLQSEAAERARQSMAGMVHVVGFGVTKRISIAVGSRHLIPLYEHMKPQFPSPLGRLVHTSLHLDQAADFPEGEVLECATELEDWDVAMSVLRHLVIDHFQLIPRDQATIQKLCARLNVPYRQLQFVHPAQRMLPP